MEDYFNVVAIIGKERLTEDIPPEKCFLECSICFDSFRNGIPCFRLEISEDGFNIGFFYMFVERYLNTEAWYWVLKHEENIISHNNICEYQKLNYFPPAILWTKVMVEMEELVDPNWITLLVYEYRKQLRLEENIGEMSEILRNININ